MAHDFMAFTELHFFYSDSMDFDAQYEDFEAVVTTEDPAESFFTIESLCEELDLLKKNTDIREDSTHLVLDFYPNTISFMEVVQLLERMKQYFRVMHFVASEASMAVTIQFTDA